MDEVRVKELLDELFEATGMNVGEGWPAASIMCSFGKTEFGVLEPHVSDILMQLKEACDEHTQEG